MGWEEINLPMILSSFSQLMLENQLHIQGASSQLDSYPARMSNDGNELIFRTEGQATLSDFFVAPQKQSSSSRFSRRFANSEQRRSVQIRKEKVKS